MTVNGEPWEGKARTVRALVVELAVPPEGIAVAVNGEVVPRGEERELKAGDRVEVIRAVGGG